MKFKFLLCIDDMEELGGELYLQGLSGNWANLIYGKNF